VPGVIELVQVHDDRDLLIRSSPDGKCWRKCHWPGYPLLVKQLRIAMASRMKTSRAALDRLLDPNNPSVTIGTLEKAAAALNRRLTVELR